MRLWGTRQILRDLRFPCLRSVLCTLKLHVGPIMKTALGEQPIWAVGVAFKVYRVRMYPK